jgi:hypothetical protein
MNTSARSKAVRAMAKLTHIDLVSAIKSKRHNPIMDREILIEEELINLQESLDSYHSAGDNLRQYPKMYAHVSQEKRAILQHCIGLVVRMMHGRKFPRAYTKQDIDDSLRRLVQLVIDETRRAGKQIDTEIMDAVRPYLTVRQRVALRDFGMDLVMQATQLRHFRPVAAGLAGRLPILRSR